MRTISAVISPAPIASNGPAPGRTETHASRARTWESFIESVRQLRPLLAALLENASCPEVPAAPTEGQPAPTFTIYLRSEDSYYKEQLQNRTYSDQLHALAREYFGHPLRIAIELTTEQDRGESIAARKERERKAKEAELRAQAQNHPMIREAQNLFGGELGPIEIIQSRSEHV